MRELKFRYVYQNISTGEIHKEIHTIFSIENSRPSPNNPPMGCVVLARDEFTGLEDKNGKEIFEGDIIRYNHASIGHPLDLIYIAIIEYQIDKWHSRFHLKPLRSCDYDHEMFFPNCEVSGNVYENPELMEAK